MNDAVSSWPDSASYTTCSISAWPTPWATPPWIWPLSVSGLITVPTSSAITYATSATAPVSGSISTSHTWQPLGHVSDGGENVAVSYSPGSRPFGSAAG